MSDRPDEEPPADGPLGFAGAAARARAPAPAPRSQRPPGPPAVSSRYTWFVGIVATIVIVYVTINTVTTAGTGSRGVAVGALAPPFAAPLVVNALGDHDYVNVARRMGQGHGAGKVAACRIHRADVLNLCALYAAKPLLLAFVATHGSPCAKQLDTLQRITARRSDVNVAAITIKSQRGDARDYVRHHGWTFPVAYDRDGVLSTLYNVVICPEMTFIARGGRVAGTSFGDQGEAEVNARLDALVAGRPLPAGR